MTWEGYWLPHLVDWTIGAAVIATVASIVTVILRRAWRELRDAQEATAKVAGVGAQRAAHAAHAATVASDGTGDVLRRLETVEGALEGMKDATSASLAQRARDDLRFRRLEQAAALERRLQGGKHAAEHDPEGD